MFNLALLPYQPPSLTEVDRWSIAKNKNGHELFRVGHNKEGEWVKMVVLDRLLASQWIEQRGLSVPSDLQKQYKWEAFLHPSSIEISDPRFLYIINNVWSLSPEARKLGITWSSQVKS